MALPSLGSGIHTPAKAFGAEAVKQFVTGRVDAADEVMRLDPWACQRRR
jgi:hypothetical protein